MNSAAHQAATSPLNDLLQPTDAQKDAGNYQKGHIKIQGLDIAIENPAGSERTGKGPDGKPWSSTLTNHYGYIKGTVGRDKDHIDSFIGPNPESKKVFVVNQQDPGTGKFDEHKVMIGFNTLKQAQDAYQSNYAADWKGMKSIIPMTMDTFKSWIMQGNTKAETGTIMKSLGDLKLNIGDNADVRQLGEKQVVFKDPQKADGAFFRAKGIPYNETQGGWVVGNRRLPELSSELKSYFSPDTGSGYVENIPGVTPNADQIQIDKSKRDFSRFLEIASKKNETIPGKVRDFIQKNYPELAKKYEVLLTKVEVKPSVLKKKDQLSLFPGIRAALKSTPQLAGTIGSDQRGIHYAPKQLNTLRGARNESEAATYSNEIKRRMRQSTEYVESPTAIPGYSKSDLKKLGRYNGEVNATATPDIKSPGESWYKHPNIPHTIDISYYYDGNKDVKGFTKEANKITAANPQFNHRNVLANMIQQAGYPGYVMNANDKTGERWAFGFGRIPVIKESANLKAALESGKLKDIPFNPAPTGATENSKPGRTYKEASDTKAFNSHNTWIRQSADQDNSNRQLMVQFSTHLINKTDTNADKDSSTKYYDALYSGSRPGYTRLHDFWEIPQWMGFASHFMPNADVYVIQDMKEAKKFLKGAGYDRVLFSAIDVNTAFIKDLAATLPEVTFNVGGYTEKGTFDNIKNLKFYKDMEAFAKDNGFDYSEGTDYRHFVGSSVIPRLTMSQGCLHKCAFCVVPKNLVETPLDVIIQQAESFKVLDSGLVYLNDKTFGQAKNYTHLVEVNKIMKKNNPEFKGFIIQTTAASVNKMSDQFLKDSGIKYIEIGVESYNDFILKGLHKPHNEAVIDKAMDKIRAHNLKAIPNVIIGLQEETAETYARTQDFLERNKDIISHANIYNLALYKDSELGKKITSDDANDIDENILTKSFHTDKKIHEGFSETVYSFGQNQLTPASPKDALGAKTGKYMTKESVIATIKPITDKIKGGLTVKVVDNSIKDLHGLSDRLFTHLLENITEGNNLLGVYDPDNKTIYLFSDMLRNPEQAQRILFHEMAHHGLDNILGKRFISVLNHVLLATNMSDKQRLTEVYFGKGKQFSDLVKVDQLLVAEERLAEMAETGIKPNVMERIYSFVRESLRAMGFTIEFSNADIRDLIHRAREYAMTGGPVWTDMVGDKIRDFRGALEYKEPGVTFHEDTGEISIDGEEGIVFVGTDHSNVNMKGEMTSSNGMLYADHNMGWTLSKGGTTRVEELVKKGYTTIAIVAYPDNLTSMEKAPYFSSAVKRAIFDAYGEKRGQSIVNEAELMLRRNPKKPMAQALAGLQREEWLLKGKKLVSLKDVAQSISVENWKDIGGKIVGIGRYKKSFFLDPGQMDIYGFINESAYPGVIKFSHYYKLPEPIDFVSLMSKSKHLSDKLKKNPWLSLTSVSLTMHKSDSAVIPALIRAGKGDMSVLERITTGEYGPGIKEKDGSIKSAIKSINPNVDAAMAGARGLKDKTAWEKIQEGFAKFKTNTEHFVNYEKSWGAAEETLRRYENIQNYAMDKTSRFMAGITKMLKTRDNQDLFERTIILRELTKESSSGKLAETFAKTGELPFGYVSVDEMKIDLANYEKLAAANKVVTKALKANVDFMNDLRADLVKHGLLPEDVMTNPEYFHHQVHIYNTMVNAGSGLVSKDVRKHKQSWQKKRTGYAGDYNTNFFESQGQVIVSMITQVETAKTHIKLGKDFQADFNKVLNGTRAEAIALGVNEAKYIKENLKKNIDKFLPGFTSWQPERGNRMYETLSLTEKNMKKVMDLLGDVRSFETEMNMSAVLDLLDRFPNFNDEDLFVKRLSKLLNPQMGVSARDIVRWMKANPEAKRVLAIGEAKPFLIVPKSLALQLDNFRPPSEPALHALFAAEVQRRWKQWQLFNPARVVKYSFNNATGDTDVVWAFRPAIITKYAKQATIDAFKYVYGKDMTQAMKDEFDWMSKADIIGSGMTTQDIDPVLMKSDAWKLIFRDPKENIVTKYFGTVMKFNTFRENILRIASFRYMRDEINAGREAGLNFAASKNDRIKAIPDPMDRAARMARDLVGDYGNTSHAGQSLRKYVIPFYSWMEINAPRYIRLMKNEIQSGSGKGVSGRTLGVAGWGAAKLSIRMAAYYTLVNVWNWAFFPDEDDEMRRLGRDQLHLILGRNDDGSVRSNPPRWPSSSTPTRAAWARGPSCARPGTRRSRPTARRPSAASSR